MKKSTIFLVALGTFCMGFTLLTRHFFEISLDVEDFLKGIGAAFIMSSLFIQWKHQHKSL